ncbi:hypothetical protein KKA53_02665 [Candidatus Dependentiae bacterium]|nr:hypothetical protein [Candidatus Dependentiae bacterium]
MHINATFLVQIINFLITYHVLNIFLLKPVITSLKEKKLKRKKLEQKIKIEEEALRSLEKEKSDSIVIFQEHVKETYPFVSLAISEKLPESKHVFIEKIDANQLKQAVTQALVKRVPNAY